MQSQNRFFDDLSKMATGAMGTLAGMRREMETAMRQRMEEFIGGLDLVKREEFDAVKDMAARARAETEALKARIAAMEAGAAPKAAARTAAKPATKPAAKPAAKPATKAAPNKPAKR